MPQISWSTVVNNSYPSPTDSSKNFFSYNQPSINDAGLVVFRARAKALTGEGGNQGGAGQPVRGIFTRDMSIAGSPINALAVNNSTPVPTPNNLGTKFTEFPAFPRIDASSNTIAFRAQSQPVYEYETGIDPDTDEPITTRAGTSGVYTTQGAGGTLVTGASQLGLVPGYSQYQVPNTAPGTKFDQFPGAPSPTGNLVTFKGNFTTAVGGQTGVYYRDVVNNGPVVEIARSGMTMPTAAVPRNGVATFGSTAPPSAAAGKVVFTGLDNEAAPKAGGIFLADLLNLRSGLTTVAGFNTKVPYLDLYFSAFGEALSFDGRYVGFWAGWGSETFEKTVSCPNDGNIGLLTACLEQDINDGSQDGNYTFNVLKNQGIFLADTWTPIPTIYQIAQRDSFFDDFLFWTFSGMPPGTGESPEGDAEPPRWRSSAFVAIDGNDVVFKALNSSGATGLYAKFDVDSLDSLDPFALLETGWDGGLVEPMAAGLPIATLGIERDGFRNGRIAINVSMANELTSMAGIYVAQVPEPGTLVLMGIGLAGLLGLRRKPC